MIYRILCQWLQMVICGLQIAIFLGKWIDINLDKHV